jgi:hypothetical protein
MAAENPNIKHIEVDGIKLNFDMSIFEDDSFVLIYGAMIDSTLNENEKAIWYSRFLRLLFGDDKAYEIIRERKKLNDGKSWSDFFGDVLEAVNAKN